MKSFEERLNGLRWRLRAMRRLWSPGAQPHMPFLAPEPFDAVPRGRLETPWAGERIEREQIDVAGWMLFPKAPTSRVELQLNGQSLGRARLGVDRPDLAELTDNPHARFAGFNMTAELTGFAGREQQAVLEAIAISTTGEQYALEPVPLTIAMGDGDDSSSSDLSPAPRPTPKPGRRDARQILVYTHQLNLGGAQLYLMDLIRELAKHEGLQLTVASATDGSLRGELEALGIPVHVRGAASMDEFSAHLGRLEELTLWCSDRDFELVLINTATGLAVPGAELAEELDVPAVWAIHESFSLATLWGEPHPRVRAKAEGALRSAAAVLFEADATRAMFDAYLEPARAHVLPYGIDLAPIDAEREHFDRAAARREAGIPEDAELVICVGTVEPRKAQLPLAQAFELIAESHPKAHLAFVGGDEKQYSKMLASYISRATAAERIELIPVTPDVQRWYAMADFLVCASDVESLPRTVLEAMAWETPVLATDVFGLPELIDDGETGWLCEARDTTALARGLDRALNSPEDERRKLGQNARSLVERRHSLSRYADQVATLIDQLLRQEKRASIDA